MNLAGPTMHPGRLIAVLHPWSPWQNRAARRMLRGAPRLTFDLDQDDDAFSHLFYAASRRRLSPPGRRGTVASLPIVTHSADSEGRAMHFARCLLIGAVA